MTTETLDAIFAIEGEREPRSHTAHPDSTITELLAVVVQQTGRGELVEVLVEDADDALDGQLRLREIFVGEFKLIHVASKGKIEVTVEYGAKTVTQAFKPSATMEKIIRWAISPGELNLEAPPEDLQLKFHDEVIPADTHLGQIAKGHKKVKVALVFKIKPQG